MTAHTTSTRPEHLRIGDRGEALAARYLEEKHRLIVLSKNWRCPQGELDLVLTDGHILIVCEVKTRTSDNFGTPAEAVDDAKAGRIRRLARRWRVQHHVAHVDTRYDIVSVHWPTGEVPQVTHLKGVL